MTICVMHDRQIAVYIMTNQKNGTLYVGVTSQLPERAFQHKQKQADGFTKRYNLTTLVYYELCTDIRDAIAREKQIKAGSRKKKLELIEQLNPNWKDLSDDF